MNHHHWAEGLNDEQRATLTSYDKPIILKADGDFVIGRVKEMVAEKELLLLKLANLEHENYALREQIEKLLATAKEIEER